MLSVTVPPVVVEVVEGDIAAQDVDAVVNAANTELWMGAGVAGALKRGGGPEIEREAMAQGPIEPGTCVITTGGRLPARFVIHAAVMKQDLRTSAAYIEEATRSALSLADGRGLRSIALPAFGTGVGGFPIDECAGIMMDAVRAMAPQLGSVRLVRLVLFGTRSYEIFTGAARRIDVRHASGTAS